MAENNIKLKILIHFNLTLECYYNTLFPTI